MNYEVRFTKYEFSVRRLRRRDKMRKVFTGLFVVTLVLVFCCPLMGGEVQSEFGETSAEAGLKSRASRGETPALDEDSGLTWYQVAGVLALLGGGGALGWTGCRKMQAIRLEPQPLEVKRIAECATRKELDDFKTEVREDFRRVHNRIDSNDRATAEIKGKLDVIAQNQQKLIDLITQRHG